jgi:hypothetical protein
VEGFSMRAAPAPGGTGKVPALALLQQSLGMRLHPVGHASKGDNLAASFISADRHGNSTLGSAGVALACRAVL